MSNRTKQQKVDVFDLNYPKKSKTSETIHVDDCDNITEEIELSLFQLQQAHDLTTDEILEATKSRKKGKEDV
jgi:hypothetical protein